MGKWNEAIFIGIYAIINKINNKIYIGSSQNVFRRGRVHFWEIKRGFHRNAHLTNAVEKYGESNFEFYLIFECEKEDLPRYEQFFIDFYHATNREIGYNIALKAYRTEHSQETKDKISKSKTGTKRTLQQRLAQSIEVRSRIRKPKSFNQQVILQFNKQGDFIKGYSSSANAARELDYNYRSMLTAICKIRKTYKRSVWKRFYL